MHQGAESEFVKSLAIPPLSPAQTASLAEEMRQSHCGKLPEPFIPKMALAQRARDTAMAIRMAQSDPSDGAVLVTGAGHARRDRGVPFVLRHLLPGANTEALAFIEVQTRANEPDEYAQGFGVDALPFDFVWFTPRLNDEDPCAAFK